MDLRSGRASATHSCCADYWLLSPVSTTLTWKPYACDTPELGSREEHSDGAKVGKPQRPAFTELVPTEVQKNGPLYMPEFLAFQINPTCKDNEPALVTSSTSNPRPRPR